MKMSVELEMFRNELLFLDAEAEALKDAPYDTEIKFQCPVCQGKAIVIRCSYNGHTRSECTKCGIKSIE